MNDVSVVLAHGGWADGTSWARVITGLAAHRIKAVAAPLPLTDLADDVAALNRSIERMPGSVVLAAHAYAGAVIGLARPERVKALVYVNSFAPDEGEKLTDLFFRAEPHPQAPKLAPDSANLMWLPEDAFPKAFAQNASVEDLTVLKDRAAAAAILLHDSPDGGACIAEEGADLVPHRRARSHDRPGHAAFHG